MVLDLDPTDSPVALTEKEYGPSLQEAPYQTSFLQRVNDLYERLGCWVITFASICAPFIFLYMCFKPSLWIFVAAYFLWTHYDRETPHKGGRRLEWIGKLKLWRYRRDYFPIRLVKTAELPPSTTYLFACFPHGMFTYGASTNFLCDVNKFDEAFPGLTLYKNVANMIFGVPFWRELALFYGACSVSAQSILHILTGPPGNVSVVHVGGLAEMRKSFPSTNCLVLKNRKGFVRLALKAGSSLVPVYSFGETDAYDQYEWLQNKLRAVLPARWVREPVVPIGPRRIDYLFGLFPYQRPITTVVGKPIQLPKVENPSKELVDRFHEIYMKELAALFEKYKAKYDCLGEKATLIIE